MEILGKVSALSIDKTPEWRALAKKGIEAKDLNLVHLINQPGRESRFTLELPNLGFFLDARKNLVTEEALDLLLDLLKQANFDKKKEAMFQGEKINTTENRAVLHTALRAPKNREVMVDGENVMPDIHKVLDKMKDFSDRVRNGKWRGHAGKKITHVVNIGIGGSDLGPKMAYQALKHYADGPEIRFVSNVDATDFFETTKDLDPETTLFVVASKTFTTQETMTNAETAKNWVLRHFGENKDCIAKHFVALSTNTQAVQAFGIDAENNMFEFWDFVGGRYSVWSAIGLSLAIGIGFDKFREFLDGAFVMDEHFRNTPASKNIPVLMALMGIWYNNFMGAESYAVLPYDQYLALLPKFLQQLDMESSGKGVNKLGINVEHVTGHILWGEPGTDSQHSFFQLIHQGRLVPADFIGFMESLNPIGEHHKILMANFLAQTQALAAGKDFKTVKQELHTKGKHTEEEIEALAPHKVFPGNKPTNSLLINQLTPKTLGALIALYEHRTFTQGIVWNINSFDQFGVELGKKLATAILKIFKDKNPAALQKLDASTRDLAKRFMGTSA
jgi:glucose-6-phosphate isomerase